jgi:hypothetical protein
MTVDSGISPDLMTLPKGPREGARGLATGLAYRAGHLDLMTCEVVFQQLGNELADHFGRNFPG